MRILWARLPSFVNCSLLCSWDCNRRRLEKSGWNVRERLVDNPGQARVPYILFRKERSGAARSLSLYTCNGWKMRITITLKTGKMTLLYHQMSCRHLVL